MLFRSDPITKTEQRESLRRLVEDVSRLPAQQRSALLMRELQGLSYEDLAATHERITEPSAHDQGPNSLRYSP